ncbi:MAG: transcriptional regulator, LuxR family [Streptosporangiaceae bacterium]|nr:transcriptional regulator, LuxR family [Streptosporangiaceae bacterium]
MLYATDPIAEAVVPDSADRTAGIGSPIALHGRDGELEILGQLLDRARRGHGGALVIAGDPGLGRTALLEATLGRAGPGFRTLATRGVRQERALPLAGLHRLLGPMSEEIRRLPEPQAAALTPIAGTGDGPAADPFALYGAVGRLLAETSRRGPVLCCADDVQWLDRVSLEALAFTARRVADDPIIMLLSTGTGGRAAAEQDCLADIPRLTLSGVDEAAGLRILEDRTAAALPADLAVELLELACGNPLALVELAAALTREQLSGQAPAPLALPASGRLRAHYRRRYLRLPEGARRLVLMAAADDRLDLDTLARAAARADVDLREFEVAQTAGLVRLEGEAVAAPSRLVRSCLYADASPADRHAVHAVLAAVLDREWDLFRRSWHLAAATREPDGRIADELGAAAAAARRSGDFSDSSRAWERAAALSPTLEARAERCVQAATDAWTAGRPGRARTLLRQAGPFIGTLELRGRADLLRGEIELRDGSPAVAGRILTEAADRLIIADGTLAITALLQAGEAACAMGDRDSYLAVAEHAAALRTAGGPPIIELMRDHLAGMAATLRGRHEEAAVLLERVLRVAEPADDCAAMTRASLAALTLGDGRRAQCLATRALADARARGLVNAVPWSLWVLAQAELLLGRHRAALAVALEGLRLARAAGQAACATDHLATLALLSAFQGDRETATRYLGDISVETSGRGPTRADAIASWARACLELADDRPAEAAGRLRQMTGSGPGHPVVRVLAIPHLVEAAVLSGRPATALRALEVFERWAEGTRSPARSALAYRCRALLAEGDGDGRVEERFSAALRLHRHGGSAFELARTEFLYGHWLRRRRRPRAAREHLRTALWIFQDYDAERWTDRARAELRAAGDTVERTAPSVARGLGELTAQQAQVARLVAEGATNREIAVRLGLSHRTIDHHLRNVFSRLGIRSRVELARLFG